MDLRKTDALPKPYSRVRWLLRHLAYDAHDVAAIVEQLRQGGSTAGLPMLDEIDRAPIEFLLSRPDV